MNKAIEDLQTKLIQDAIKHIDTDELSKKLAKKLEEQMVNSVQECLDNSMDLSYWITEELTNEKTVIGKAFDKAIRNITKRMVLAIDDNSKQ